MRSKKGLTNTQMRPKNLMMGTNQKRERKQLTSARTRGLKRGKCKRKKREGERGEGKGIKDEKVNKLFELVPPRNVYQKSYLEMPFETSSKDFQITNNLSSKKERKKERGQEGGKKKERDEKVKETSEKER